MYRYPWPWLQLTLRQNRKMLTTITRFTVLHTYQFTWQRVCFVSVTLVRKVVKCGKWSLFCPIALNKRKRHWGNLPELVFDAGRSCSAEMSRRHFWHTSQIQIAVLETERQALETQNQIIQKDDSQNSDQKENVLRFHKEVQEQFRWHFRPTEKSNVTSYHWHIYTQLNFSSVI